MPLPAPQSSDPKSAVSPREGWLRALALTAPIAQHPTRIFSSVIADWAHRQPDALALLSDGETLTYGALSRRANRYARWALANGVAKGDTVCLLMQNCPDYMAVWLGITSVGGVVALLNTNLTGRSLSHCIDVAAPDHAIVSASLLDAFETARPSLSRPITLWRHGAPGDNAMLDAIAALSDEPLRDDERRDVTIEDRALYIYTSGTTGLPKAAKVTHLRLMTWTHWFAGMMGTTADDRMYNCLPMYHSIGGAVAAGAVLINGGSVVLREKFSARDFWSDVTRWDCTLVQYIGELCRYLLKTPRGPHDTAHRVRICCGNGLRPDIWEAFKARFAIPQILEFYASTEGNLSLFNAEGKVGAIGRIPSFLAHRFPAAIVRVDIEDGQPLRDADGRCLRCAPGETGEAIGLIGGAGQPGTVQHGGRYDGYTSQADTDRKVLRDVFAPGDAWFRTGDLMTKDAAGFWYFIDRVGDTFRWKGENVSTFEVAEAIAEFPGIEQANVYGVAVAGCDGKAGMAALAMDRPVDLAALRAHIHSRLPSYARPLFIRMRHDLEVTTTFKHMKTSLAKEGFDPAATGDAVFFDDASQGAFMPVDAALYARIQAGTIRL